MDLILIIVLSLLLVPLVAVTTGALRIVMGLLFILFFPGYTMIAALFPKKGDLDGIEHLALSFGLSIAVPSLIGLGLNYTPWGIRLFPIVLSLLPFIVIMASIAWYRRRRLPPQERFEPQLLPSSSAPSLAEQLSQAATTMGTLGAYLLCLLADSLPAHFLAGNSGMISWSWRCLSIGSLAN